MTTHNGRLATILAAALLMAVGCSDPQAASTAATDAIQPLMEQALKNDDPNEARQLLSEAFAKAGSDSLSYYHCVLMQTKLYAYLMLPDSFACNIERLEHYLQRMEKPDKHLLSELRMQQGVYQIKILGNAPRAIDYYKEALQLLDDGNADADSKVRTLVNMGDAYSLIGAYDQSVNYFRLALEKADSTRQSGPDMTIITSIGIATAYSAMGYFEQSAQWWQRADSLSALMNDHQLFNYLNNQGNDYFWQRRYEDSRRCFERLDSLFDNDPNHQWECMFGRVNLSDVYIKLGLTEKAQPLIDEALPYFEQMHFKPAVYYLQTQRIELALKRGQTAEALRIAEQQQGDDSPLPQMRLLRQQVLRDLYRQTDQWKLWEQAVSAYHTIQDSIADDQMQMRVSASIMAYQHQKEMLQKEQQIAGERRTHYLVLALFALTLIGLLLLVIITIMKRRQQKLKDEIQRNRVVALRMEAVRNRISPHFISNALSAQVMAQAEGRPIDLNPLVQLLHRGLEQTGNSTTTLADELTFINFYCEVQGPSVGPDFALHTDIAPDVDPEHVTMPSMTLQLFVENAIKHGLKPMPPQPGRQRQVTISARREQQGTRLAVTDNGVGIGTNKRSTPRGMGLSVLRNTITLLNEQNQQQIDYAVENIGPATNPTGCCSWIYLPDNYEYTLKT